MCTCLFDYARAYDLISFHGEVGAVVLGLLLDGRVETHAQWVRCSWRSHDTKTAILGRQLHTGTTKTKCPSAQFALFVPCDRQLQGPINLLACQIPSFYLALHQLNVRIYHTSEHIVLSGTF